MLVCLLAVSVCVLMLSTRATAQGVVVGASLVFHGARLNLARGIEVYPAPSANTDVHLDGRAAEPLEYDWSGISAYLASQQDAKIRLADIPHSEPSQWLLLSGLVNGTAKSEVALVVHGSIVDTLEVHVYSGAKLEAFQATGYLYHRSALSYVLDLNLEPSQPYDILIRMESRYLTGPIKIELRDPDEFYQQDAEQRALVYLCLGALIILGSYNLFLFVGVRDPSYLFYSLYLFSGLVGWAAIFNILANHFDIYDLGWNLIPFYLAPVFNSLFLLSFLRVRRQEHPVIFYLVCVLMVINVLLVFAFTWITDYLAYYSFILYNSTLWIVVSLWASIKRYLEGYTPARFFVLGFAVLALGGMVSILPGLGIEAPVDNFYLLTLVAQTMDMTLLALALADKIALMRVEKQAALELAHQKDLRMLEVEKDANRVLAQANENLQKAVALHEEQERKRKNFLLLVNHELRTPVNAMMDSVANMNVQHLRYGVESLSVLLDQLSIFSELNNDAVSPVPTRLNLHRFGDKLTGVASRLCADKNIHIQCEVSADSDIFVDAFLLEAAVKPILDNACRFTESGTICLALSFDSTIQDSSNLIIKITDSGVGIPLPHQARILSAFEQSSEGYTRQSGGLGLGLYISKTAMDILGGTLTLNTPTDQTGLCVTLALRCDPLVFTPVLHGKVEHALVVEDNVVNAKVLSAILAGLGVSVAVAENGQQAVDYIENKVSTTPDINFMDLQMPVMDGFEATKQLRAQGVTTPIIAVTANSEQASRHKCLSVGMSAVLVKPVRADDIQAVIEDLGGQIAKA